MCKSRYHGAFNHFVGKQLYIKQQTHLDINYAVTCLASFIRNPNKPAFHALGYLIQYIHSHSQTLIIYPNMPINKKQYMKYMDSSKQFKQYSLPSYAVFFSDSSFANILPHRRSMQSNCEVLNWVVISWSTKKIQTAIAADSTDAKIRSLYTTIKKIVSFSHFLTSSSI